MKITIGLVVGFSLLIIAMSTDVGGQQSSNAPQPLIVGTKEAPPFSMKTVDGQWTGPSIDLWRQIAAELNLQFEFRELALKQLLEGVTDGSLEVLPYRLQHQDFGIALQPSPLRESIDVTLLHKIREKAWQDKLSQYLGE